MKKNTVKSELIRKLEENRGKYFSGEALASELNVSRAAVSQAVKTLRGAGYPISSCTNLGYSLSPSSDLISEQGVRLFLPEKYKNLSLLIFDTIDSTNMEARRQSLEGREHGTVIIANEQTAGRGRLGRNFFSPADTGLYLSILLKPNASEPINPLLITTAASVAVCRAIKKVSDIKAEIKWVNDIYVDGKKVSGILTEGISNFETGAMEYIILGIGINCQMPVGDFPEDIRDIASSILGEDIKEGFQRNMLAAEIIKEVLDIYFDLNSLKFMEEYRRLSMVIGKPVKLLKNYNETEFEQVKVLDIDDMGGLVVEHPDGRIETLRTGEISIRTK